VPVFSANKHCEVAYYITHMLSHTLQIFVGENVKNYEDKTIAMLRLLTVANVKILQIGIGTETQLLS
jgi:hypothetical protein